MAKLPRWKKQCKCGHFMPDEHDRCDTCLIEEYGLWDYLHHDSCDQIGLGPMYIEEDVVIAAIRKAEKRVQNNDLDNPTTNTP